MAQKEDTLSGSRVFAPWERPFEKVRTPLEDFVHGEVSGGIILLICTVIALVAANSFMAEAYHNLVETPVSITVGGWALQKSLHHWINDGLMALFFFVVGLEIKREVLVGELSDIRQAALPIIAAIGGMVFPALVYTIITPGGEMAKGWGIPMATDIAFALGVMAMLGNRVSRSLFTFLLALAIVDDLGAVLVIAIFYTEDLNTTMLGVSALMFGLLVVFNMLGIRKPLPYFLIGIVLWVAMLKSGVHATIAGVLTALTIPARPQFEPQRFSLRVRGLMDRFDAACKPGESILRNQEMRSVLQSLENGARGVETALQRLEHSLHLPVAFVIIPIFALANAGVPIDFSTLGETFYHPVTLGVVFGLLVGKLIGIAGVSWVALRFGIGRLPEGATFPQIIGVAFLAAIGFTMSIFITELAFKTQPELLLYAKTGIICASLVAGVAGYVWLRVVSPRPPVVEL